MYYKTRETSETGKKIISFRDKLLEAKHDHWRIAQEFGCEKFEIFNDIFDYGGFASLVFEKKPDLKYWRKCGRGYFPRLNTKQGKEINKVLQSVKRIKYSELNEIVGIQMDLGHIGFCITGFKTVVFSIPKEYASGFVCPKDCKEITFSQYENLVNKGGKA